jgi:hypothetical protein
LLEILYTFGWCAMLYPTGNKLFINVPTAENTTSYQFVMNTITGAWCRYLGWNANVFETVQDSLYFGGNNGTVYQAEYGTDDDGASISGQMIPPSITSARRSGANASLRSARRSSGLRTRTCFLSW